MLGHPKDLGSRRSRPVHQVDDGEVRQAARKAGERKHPGATIQQEHENDDDSCMMSPPGPPSHVRKGNVSVSGPQLVA